MGIERDESASEELSLETLEGRLRTRERNPQWKKAPRYIEPAECIGCDSCIRACPPEFDAIHNHGPDVVIVSELCSGCGKCVWACPMDCIYVDDQWERTSNEVWINVLAKAAGHDGE